VIDGVGSTGEMDTLENVERGHFVLSFDLTRARSVRAIPLSPSPRGELLVLIVRTIMGRLDKFPGGKRSGILRTSGGFDVTPPRVYPVASAN